MIDETRLRDDLIRLLTATEDNIRTRCEEEPDVNRPLEERYEAARQAGRTGTTLNTWREGEITQAGVAWLLACVFVRFLEDNDLLRQVYLAGPGDRLKTAQDRVTVWYRSHTNSNHRQYLLDTFAELEHLPGLKGLLDRTHNPLWSLGPDGDGAKAILDFFQSANPDTQVLRHDFTDTAKSTRFLGDLYQNISESARKRYALLQTPDFIVDFILDRTLEPALKEFPLDGFRLIDPACGSGHFLLEAFDRLFQLWANREGDPVVVAEHAFQCVYGVDLNPYAAAIARFRLLIAALRKCEIHQLDRAPDWQIHVAAGDALLFGRNKMVPGLTALPSEDPEELRVMLQTAAYHAVVGNPPYINVQDSELRRLYRRYYGSCSGKYQLSVPFTEVLFDLAEAGGYVGMITSNAFMKRTFGKTLIEKYLPTWDITHVIDTSGVYLPGHGTPTAIIIGRQRHPIANLLRVVRGIRGEVSVPVDPASAPVWSEIRDFVDHPGHQGLYVSINDVQRNGFHKHPWSIGGGGAAELKERLDEAALITVKAVAASVGYMAITGEDDLFLSPQHAAKRKTEVAWRPFCEGDGVRHWQVFPDAAALIPRQGSWCWPYRTSLKARLMFGKTPEEMEKPWFAYMFTYGPRFSAARMLVFADVATHNNFALVRGGMVFNRHAPMLLLRGDPDESTYVGLLGLINSSSIGFWLRQVCYPKGGDHVGTEGARIRKTLWDERFDYDGAKIESIPIPEGRPTDIAIAIQSAADERSDLLPAALVARQVPTRASLATARDRAHALLLIMIALQEELDWNVYELYGIVDGSFTLPIDQVPPIELGQRTFEILLARALETGEVETEWFNRHHSTPSTKIPAHWPAPYRALVQRRLDAVVGDRDLALIEKPEYKRRWNLPSWEDLEEVALRDWLLDRLEGPNYWPTGPPSLTSVARLADAVRVDSEFLQVAELYRSRPDFDLSELVHELVVRESVPFLPILRYRESGLRKRIDWESTWELQRREDAGEAVEIPVPPKYERVDYASADCWRLRGKLDVPNERWISYPNLERDADKSLVITWAGYDHGQQALALAGYANEMRTNEGWPTDRLVPVLAGLEQLQPWLDQWHNEIDPDRQQRLNESIRTFVESEMTQLGITTEKIREWRPLARVSATKPLKARARTTAASKSPAPTE